MLGSQVRRDADLTHFEHHVPAVLSEVPQHTRRMSSLAAQTNATLARLSNVVRRLEERGTVSRSSPSEDRRASDVHLAEAGWAKVQEAAPGHVANVRHHVVDALGDEQAAQLTTIADAVLGHLEPRGTMSRTRHRYDRTDQGTSRSAPG